MPQPLHCAACGRAQSYAPLPPADLAAQNHPPVSPTPVQSRQPSA